MQATIERRELIVLEGSEGVIRGTYHKPQDDKSGGHSYLTGSGRIGLLFLNGLYATRAGNGDVAVYWADSFAASGYPSFRLDLPGFGDSDGDPPADCLGFINRGGYTTGAVAIIKEIVARFDLSGVVIVGHCAGAVSAIYAAAASAECKGLVLLDPYFHLPQIVRRKLRRGLHAWALQSPLGRLCSKIYDSLKQVRLVLRGSAPPENANSSLLRRWKEVASTGLPILVLKAPSRGSAGAKPRAGDFDYFQYILELAGRKHQAVIQVMDGANHSFSNQLARAAVRRHTEHWLNAFFPLMEHEEGVIDALSSSPESREHRHEHSIRDHRPIHSGRPRTRQRTGAVNG